MNSETTQHEGGLSRRTIVKGAAWSIPVMAAAVAAPAAVATGGATWDVQVTGACENDYELSALESIVGSGLVSTVEGILAPLGFTSGASRTFTITALDGTVPSGTQFTLSYPAALLNLTALEGLIEANALLVATVNATDATITLNGPLTEGQTITIDYTTAIIDLGVASSVTLSLVGDDNPAGSDAADSATVSSLLAADLDLGGIPALALLGVSGSLEVQICA
jgi:hypothetical protein